MRRHSVLQLMIVGALILLAFFPSAAAAGAYEVSGRVVDEQGNGIEGVALEIAGESISTAFTNANGEWTAEVSGVVTVIPSKGGYGFFPKELTVSQETAGEVHFQGVTGKIVGRVVINGEAPGRE
ncbi:MAG: carboxypeptidase regulatory-like domain-containing protein, partial [Firmicutes bacterium]|nr:carboxypeptidase regulatory-like domain-containing protein [Bacillota bacterium]